MTYLVLAAAILIVHAADVVYSAWAIKRHGLKEGNPVMALLSRDPVTFILWSTALLVVALRVLEREGCPAWALGFGLAARVMVMIRNVNIVSAVRRKQ